MTDSAVSSMFALALHLRLEAIRATGRGNRLLARHCANSAAREYQSAKVFRQASNLLRQSALQNALEATANPRPDGEGKSHD